MVVVVLLMAAVAMLSLSFLSVLRSAHKESQGSRETLSALYVCEAGLSAAVESLSHGGTGALGTKSHPVGFGEQSYWVEATDIGSGRTQLEAYGRDNGSHLGVELVVQRTPQGFFRWAAFGDEIVHMDSNARTDSYDSSVGTYLSQQVNGSGSNAYADTDGDVASNASITMDSNIGVWGDANPGPSGSVSGNLGNISGNTTPLPTTVDLPDVVLPAITTPGTSFTVASSQVLASGNYRYSSLQVNNSKTLTITGPATIVCDNFRLKSGSNIVVNAANGPVEFYVIDDFLLNSNTQIYATDYKPQNVAFHLLSDNILDPGIDVNFDEDTVDFDSGSKMYGTIYAPSAKITVDSNFELYGAMVARRIDLNSNCRIHYDETLATLGEEADAMYERLCWRVVALP